jgi:hypothetical protein
VKRLLPILGGGAALAAATAAAAAMLPLSPGTLGGGAAAVAPCDPDGFTIAYTTSRGNVTAVTVGGIKEPGCAGGTLAVALVSSSGAAVGTGTAVVPSAADPASVGAPVSPSPSASAIAGYRVTISGP